MSNDCSSVPVTVFCFAVFLIGTPANLFVSYCYHIKHPTWKRSPVQIKLFKLLPVSDITTLVTAAILAPLSGILFSDNPCKYFLFVICMFACYIQGIVCVVATSRSYSVIYPLVPERPVFQYTFVTLHTLLMASGMTVGILNANYNRALLSCQTISVILVLSTLLTSLATIICLVRSSGPLTASRESGNNSANNGDRVNQDVSKPTCDWKHKFLNCWSFNKQSKGVMGITNQRRIVNSVITLLLMNLPYTLTFVNLIFSLVFKNQETVEDLSRMTHLLILPVLTSAYNPIVLLVRKRDFSNRLKSLLVYLKS